jgi:parallel beta-helix repeat protein
MRKIFITLLLLIATLVACGQNTFRYVINANGGIAITAPLSIGGIIINSTGAELNILHDVPVSVTAVKLGYLGNLTSDIQTQLNNKQATLVSGTNIKSVGGVSLLGAGDIAVVGTGTVTSVSVTTAGGVSGTVATSTTTPNITLTLGAITPTSVAATGTVTGSNLSGTNTGDNSVNTLYSGLVTNATHTGDVTGSGALTIATGAVTLAKMANMATGSLIYRKTALAGAPEVNSLATLKTDLGLTGTNSGDQTNISGNAGTATKLYATKTINGVAFDGSANISVPSNITPGTSGNLMISNGTLWTSGTKASQGIITASDTATMLEPYTRVADSINASRVFPYDYVISRTVDSIFATALTGYISYADTNLTTVFNSAVGQMTTGGSILIKRGLYDHLSTLVVTNSNITLEGEEWSTKLKLKGDADAGTSWGNLIYCGGVSGITIKNLELNGNGLAQTKIDNRSGTNKSRSIGICANDSTGTLSSNNLLVENCYIHDFARDGVVWSRGENAVIRDCYFKNNFVAQVEFWGLTSNGKIENCYLRNGTGISLFGDNHTISNCKFKYIYNARQWTNADWGITLESATTGPDNVMINDCIFEGDTLMYSIVSYTGGMENLTLDNVTIKTSPAGAYLCYGIYLENDIGSSISNCHFTGPRVGIYLYHSDYATVRNNHLTDIEYNGIMLATGTDNVVMNNYVSGDEYALRATALSTGTVFMNNVLSSVSNTEILNEGAGTILFNNYSNTDDAILSNVYKSDIAYTATSDGLTTGLIGSGSQNITVTSASANNILCLPSTSAANIGQVITGQVGANGFELRPIAAQAATVYINNVTTNVEAAIPANTVFEIRCVDATHWILKAWTMLGAEITAIIPDAI